MSARPSNLRLLTSTLVLANAGLFSLLLYNAWSGTQAETLLATQPRRFIAPNPDVSPPARTASLAGIQDRTLFYSTRHFYSPPPPSAPPPTPPKPDYRLVGTFVIPAKPPVALLSGPAGASRKVKVGDELDGWTVSAVESGRVLFQYQGQTAEIAGPGKGGNAGMQIVPMTRTAQAVVPTQPGNTRVLGNAPLGAIGVRPFPSSMSGPRLYRPPPK